MKTTYVFSHKDEDLDNTAFSCQKCYKIDTRCTNGISIADSNKIYNEFCGMYWLWKNIQPPKDKEWISFAHYRRYLDLPFCLEDGKAYAHSMKLNTTIKTQYHICHCIQDLMTFKRVCFDDDTRLKSLFEKFLFDTELYCCNLLCMQGQLHKIYAEFMLNCYCKLKNCLDTRLIDIEGRSPYQRRIGGFLLERATGFWLKYLSGVEIVDTNMIELEIPNLENSVK